MSSDHGEIAASRPDLTALADSLGEQLRGRPIEKAVELLQLFIEGGLSARAAAREAGVTEQIAMLWINTLGLKRPAGEIREMQKNALKAGRQRHADHLADLAVLKAAATSQR